MSIKIMIGADIVPTKSNYELFSTGNVESLIGKTLYNRLCDADYTIFNLETPLVDKATPIMKNGPCLMAPTSTIEGLAKINPHFFTLANNHIMDFGKVGLDSTIALLRSYGISYAGVGNNLQEASGAVVVELKNIKIGIYCCAEHEFSIATEETAGANPFDPLNSLDHIVSLKEKADYVIVLYHGGKEHYRYPSPNLQKVCRKIVDKGANLVVCQHSHCIGSFEKWNGGTIIYGQGNFLFDMEDNEFWNTSLLLECTIDKDRFDIEYLPLCKKNNVVRLADQTLAERILRDFHGRSREIDNQSLVKAYYDQFTAENMWVYYRGFAGGFLNNPLFRLINKLLRYKLYSIYPKSKYKKADAAMIYNVIDCEAHRELVLNGLMKEIQK